MKKFLLMCFSFGFAISVWAQDRVVTGKVTSQDDGSPLPGVNVLLKGTTNGTVTDSDGAYKITIPSEGGSLIFSFIGLQTSEIPTGDRAIVDVQLGLDVKQLSEIVVTGAGVATEKKKLGIAVESVTSDKLPAAPTASIDQALVGKIAGAQISSVSGNPGDPVQILLRGINTIQRGTLPMILVDGVQVISTDINSLDLSNIERVEVVQGAASATLYGAQGANGVIQIFTKKGQKGHLNINFSTSYSSNEFINVNNNLSKASLHPYQTDSNGNLIDGSGNQLAIDQYGNLPGIRYRYASVLGPANARKGILSPQNIADQPYQGAVHFNDHFNQVFGTGNTTNNSISISGGNDKTDFAISVANNHTVSAILPGKNGYLDRTNLTVNLGTQLVKNLTLRSTTQLIYTKNTMKPGLGAPGGVQYGLGNSQGNVNQVFGFLNTSPFFDLTSTLADGTYPIHQQGGNFLSINGYNPFAVSEYTDGSGNKVDIVQSFDLNYKVNKFVELDAKYGLNYRNETARWTYYNQSQNTNAQQFDISNGYYFFNYNGANLNGEINSYDYTSTFQNFLANAFIRTDFKDDFHMSLPIETSTQIAFDYRKRNYKELDMYGLGLQTSPPFNLENTASQSIVHNGGDYTQPFITYGYLINQKINYGNWAGVTGGFRSDWSSAFGGGSKPFTFPHVDGFVSVSEAWKNGKLGELLPYLKLRAAWGKAGIQPGPFDRYPVLASGAIGQQNAYSVQTTGNNPNLQVEVSTEFEAGTDLSFNVNQGGSWFQSINTSFTVWNRTSDNVIYTVATPLSTGAPGALTNAIGLASNGYQFSLNLPVYKSGNFSWDFTTNWGHQISKITSIAGGNDIILASSDPTGSTSLVLTPGQVIGQVNAHKTYTNIDQANADNAAAGNAPENFVMVNGKVVDKDNLNIQFTQEKYPLGNPNPKFNSSFINTFGYKDFLTFSFQFDWVYGTHLYNQTKEWMYRDGLHKDFATPVVIPGNNGDKPAAYSAYYASAYYGIIGSIYGTDNNGTRDYFWEDASFIRLRNVSVGFDFAKFAHIKGLKKLQLVMTGRNVLTFTNYTGADPEISSGTTNSAFNRQVDNSTIPNIRSYQVGLNVGF